MCLRVRVCMHVYAQESFEVDRFPDMRHKMYLAEATGLEYKQVHTWFTNSRKRRTKDGGVRDEARRRGGLHHSL
jgi:hypothetical protein